MTATDWTSEASDAGRYADLNGLHLYYEVHGSGRPLVLLHGGLGSGGMFGPVTGQLAAAGHQVIVPDLQGHGRTAAADHQEIVRKLVIISTNIKRSAIYADMLAQQGNVGAAAADNLKGTPMYE